MSTLVYSYGARQPENYDTVVEQIHMAHRYQNELVAIERARRERFQEIMLGAGDIAAQKQVVDALVTLVDTLRTGVKEARRKAEAPVPASAQTKEAIARIRGELKLARAALREMKARAASEELKAKVEENEERSKAEVRKARGKCNCYWGTYLVIEDAMTRARKALNPPRFRSWRGDGQVAVQLQGGLTVKELYACESTLLRLQTLPDTGRTSRRALERPRVIVWLRVGSDGRAPVWTKIPVLLHRPLPPDATIKWCRLIRRMVADHERWDVQFTLEVEDVPVAHPFPHMVAAIDFGWRLKDNGDLRVAMLVARDILIPRPPLKPTFTVEELVLPARAVSRLGHPDTLRSIEDKGFDVIRAVLVEWLGSQAAVPEWLSKWTETLGQWRSAPRLMRLFLTWRDRRFPGDEQIMERLEPWYHQHRHLWQWEAHERNGAIAARRERYRLWAKGVCERFGVVVIEDMDLRQLARKPAPEHGTATATAADHQRVLVAVSELRGAFKMMAPKSGTQMVEVASKNTTRECHVCGLLNDWDQAADLKHTCTGCSATWDQDFNAGVNMLNTYQHEQKRSAERAKELARVVGDNDSRSDVTAPTSGVGTPKESRWARLKREKDNGDSYG